MRGDVDGLKFQSTPPSREATVDGPGCESRVGVSIHAPLTGGDSLPPFPLHRAPVFQSTPPSREATCLVSDVTCLTRSFNPRPPHGRRLWTGRVARAGWGFQSTPPSREATRPHTFLPPLLSRFNPRPPHGRRQTPPRQLRTPRGVSIHAPLTGGDRKPPAVAFQIFVSIHAPLTGGDIPVLLL